jgi:hypothetical protein
MENINESVRVIIIDLYNSEYYMDKDYRLYNINNRDFVGWFDPQEVTIEYTSNAWGGPQILENYVICEDVFEDDFVPIDENNNNSSRQEAMEIIEAK